MRNQATTATTTTTATTPNTSVRLIVIPRIVTASKFTGDTSWRRSLLDRA
jgi:hypothetical protein